MNQAELTGHAELHAALEAARAVFADAFVAVSKAARIASALGERSLTEALYDRREEASALAEDMLAAAEAARLVVQRER